MEEKIKMSLIIKSAGMFTSKMMHLEQGQKMQDIITGEKGIDIGDVLEP